MLIVRLSILLLTMVLAACQSAAPDYAEQGPRPVVPTFEAPANTEISFAEPTPNKHEKDSDIYDISPTLDPDDNSKIYIPKDLEDCFAELNRMLHPKWIEKFRTTESGAIDEHFGLGLWMRNNWGLWGRSRLNQHFHGIGIFHPDDMSGLILTSYHRHLNQEPIRLEEQIKYYQDYWKNEAFKPRKGNKVVVKGSKDSNSK